MTLFRLDASIREDGSHSREIADLVEDRVAQGQPRRADRPPAHRHRPDPGHHLGGRGQRRGHARGRPHVRSARRGRPRRREAVDELVDRTPHCCSPYRSTTSASLSTSRPGSTSSSPTRGWRPPGQPLLAGKPAVLVTVRGGAYGAGTPRDGWDHATGWMRRILEDVWRST